MILKLFSFALLALIMNSNTLIASDITLLKEPDSIALSNTAPSPTLLPSAPLRPIAQTAIGIACLPQAAIGIIAGLYCFSLADRESQENNLISLEELWRQYARLFTGIGIGYGVSGTILLSSAKKRWDIYNASQRRNLKISFNFGI